MSNKMHRTALGRPIDMASIRAKNEKVRAVGNMNVNARGDIIDSNNRVINDSTKRVNAMYEKTMRNPQASQRKTPPPVFRRQDSQPVTAPEVPVNVSAATAENLADEIYTGSPPDFDDDIPNPEK